LSDYVVSASYNTDYKSPEPLKTLVMLCYRRIKLSTSSLKTSFILKGRCHW